MNKAIADRVATKMMGQFKIRAEEPKPVSAAYSGNLYPESAVLGLDQESFHCQESTFAMLNLALLASLLCGHALFSEHFGTPTPGLVGLLSTGFLLQLGELVWM